MTKSRDINWNIILFPRVSYLIRGRGMTVLNLLTAEPFISRHFYYMYYKQEYMYSHCLSLFSQPTSETREWFSFISGVKGVNKSTFLEFECGTKNKEKIHLEREWRVWFEWDSIKWNYVLLWKNLRTTLIVYGYGFETLIFQSYL